MFIHHQDGSSPYPALDPAFRAAIQADSVGAKNAPDQTGDGSNDRHDAVFRCPLLIQPAAGDERNWRPSGRVNTGGLRASEAGRTGRETKALRTSDPTLRGRAGRSRATRGAPHFGVVLTRPGFGRR